MPAYSDNKIETAISKLETFINQKRANMLKFERHDLFFSVVSSVGRWHEERLNIRCSDAPRLWTELGYVNDSDTCLIVQWCEVYSDPKLGNDL